MKVDIELKIKNHAFYQALQRRGMNQNQAAEYLGMSPTTFGNMINLRWLPKVITKIKVERIEEFCGCPIEEIWPQEIVDNFDKLKERKKFIKTVEAEPDRLIAFISQDNARGDPRKMLAHKEAGALVDDMLEALTEREAKVLEMRKLNGFTLDEAGEAWGVTKERIRQIEIKAINKLRGPRGEKFRQRYEDIEDDLDA